MEQRGLGAHLSSSDPGSTDELVRPPRAWKEAEGSANRPAPAARSRAAPRSPRASDRDPRVSGDFPDRSGSSTRSLGPLPAPPVGPVRRLVTGAQTAWPGGWRSFQRERKGRGRGGGVVRETGEGARLPRFINETTPPPSRARRVGLSPRGAAGLDRTAGYAPRPTCQRASDDDVQSGRGDTWGAPVTLPSGRQSRDSNCRPAGFSSSCPALLIPTNGKDKKKHASFIGLFLFAAGWLDTSVS
jgi:hypothetical protein